MVKHLNHTMPRGGIGTAPTAWPPTSPDFNPVRSFKRGLREESCLADQKQRYSAAQGTL
jgi:hypothetical protein